MSKRNYKSKRVTPLLQRMGTFVRPVVKSFQIRQVHSEKRFACPHCDKVFKSKDGIKKHMPVHTGEKNYVCKHCGKAFGDPSSRNQHEKFQHPSEGNKIICKE